MSAELNRKPLYNYLGQYNYHVYSGQNFLLELDYNKKQVRLSSLLSDYRGVRINYSDLQLGGDFEKISIVHDESKKVIELFDSDNVPDLRFEYITYFFTFNPVFED